MFSFFKYFLSEYEFFTISGIAHIPSLQCSAEQFVWNAI